eukprot:g4403.t1
MAEGGDISGLTSDLDGLSATVVTNPAGGLLGPGDSTTADLNTDAAPDNTNLSIVSMILPSNDGFIGLNSLSVPTDPGTYTFNINAYDAGTEGNDEIVGSGAPGEAGYPAPGPVGDASGTGGTGLTAESEGFIHIHRNVIGDTDAEGGIAAVAVVACGSNGSDGTDDDVTPPAATQSFELRVVNLTANQPFSPIAAIVHTSDYAVFRVGEPASLGLEVLAEGGDNADLLTEAEADAGVMATATAENPLDPGATETLLLTLEEDQLANLLLSGVTMLVNTNDAITAITGVSLADMEVGDTLTLNAIGYDTGTEANTEFVGSIPGPADGGEGFDDARDDIANEVRMHSGVITANGGLGDSRLTDIHRWDNPVARFSVTRTD